jgi:hypothetical protein
MKINRKFALLVAVLCAPSVYADGVVIDKIYHPYVDALESELEYRALVQDEQPGISTPAQIHQLSFGRAFGARMFAEVYAIGEKPRSGGFDLGAWEVELKYQLTEQGEYWADWGLLVEYENERMVDVEEFSVTLLAEKEWGNWSGAANFHVINEWGDDIDPEVETVLALQTRYRYSRLFEPGVEFYAGQNTRGIGPVLQGTLNTGVRKAVHWEMGLIFGLDNKSADQTWRFLLEYEF